MSSLEDTLEKQRNQIIQSKVCNKVDGSTQTEIEINNENTKTVNIEEEENSAKNENPNIVDDEFQVRKERGFKFQKERD